jgi:hypothetical protein
LIVPRPTDFAQGQREPVLARIGAEALEEQRSARCAGSNRCCETQYIVPMRRDQLASINWTWSNKLFPQHIGRDTGDGVYKLNTGMATLDWLIACCRRACNVLLTQAA